jgi:hypothetical protein
VAEQSISSLTNPAEELLQPNHPSSSIHIPTVIQRSKIFKWPESLRLDAGFTIPLSVMKFVEVSSDWKHAVNFPDRSMPLMRIFGSYNVKLDWTLLEILDATHRALFYLRISTLIQCSAHGCQGYPCPSELSWSKTSMMTPQLD